MIIYYKLIYIYIYIFEKTMIVRYLNWKAALVNWRQKRATIDIRHRRQICRLTYISPKMYYGPQILP